MFAWHDRSYSDSSELSFLVGRHEPGPLQFAIADYQARLREPGFRIRFGDDAFDRAVHAVLDRLSSVSAFDVMAKYPEPGGSRYGTVRGDEAVDAAREETRRAVDAEWPAIRDAVRLWRPVGEHHIAPVLLLADPRLDQMISAERGREILSMPKGGR